MWVSYSVKLCLCVCVHVYVVCDLTEERERQTVRQTDSKGERGMRGRE